MGDGPGSPCTFGSARELFEAAREAVRDNERIKRSIEAMEAREGPRSPSLEAHVRSGRADPMAATDDRIVAEEKWRRREEENCRLIDLASAVIYGKWYDGRGGIDAILDSRHADAMYWRFLCGMKWAEVGRIMCYSFRHVRRFVYDSLDTIDAYGLQRVIDGTGIATDEDDQNDDNVQGENKS